MNLKCDASTSAEIEQFDWDLCVQIVSHSVAV